mmetsp:Transcript_116188/g.369735  ORF Transcript_116188/g.369735 Transcript_116188/m.369735 type:complete len:359 (-) Transcript_116188:538-1614(-)
MAAAAAVAPERGSKRRRQLVRRLEFLCKTTCHSLFLSRCPSSSATAPNMVLSITPEPAHLPPEVPAQQALVQVGLPLEVQDHEAGRLHLLRRIPQVRHQRVHQHRLHGGPLLRIEAQQALKDIHRVCLHVRELHAQPLALALRKAMDVASGIFPLQKCDILLGRRPQEVEDHAELIMLTARVEPVVGFVLTVRRQGEAGRSRKQWATVLEAGALEHAQELRVDAADGPDVDGGGVILLQQDQLGGAVPPGDHVSRQVPAVELSLGARQLSPLLGDLATDRARQAKVTDLHRAILVHQAIRRLQVSVVDARRVEVLDADQQVVQKSVDVQWRQRDICAAQLLQVRVADLHDQIQLIEVG